MNQVRIRKFVACAVVAAMRVRTRKRGRMTIDRCTVVAVEMMESVDSSDARPGDFFRFETVNAVTSGARVVIPARTMGYGVVAVASPAGRDAHPGTLVLEPRYLVLPDGKHMGVVLNHNTDSLVESGASDSIPGYLGAIPRFRRRRRDRDVQLFSQRKEHRRPARQRFHVLSQRRSLGRALPGSPLVLARNGKGACCMRRDFGEQ